MEKYPQVREPETTESQPEEPESELNPPESQPEEPESEPKVAAFVPHLVVIALEDIAKEQDFGDFLLKRIHARVTEVLKARRPECTPKIVLMGQGAWYRWSREDQIVKLIAAKRIQTKVRINDSIEIRLTPGIGDVMVIA